MAEIRKIDKIKKMAEYWDNGKNEETDKKLRKIVKMEEKNRTKCKNKETDDKWWKIKKIEKNSGGKKEEKMRDWIKYKKWEN